MITYSNSKIVNYNLPLVLSRLCLELVNCMRDGHKNTHLYWRKEGLLQQGYNSNSLSNSKREDYIAYTLLHSIKNPVNSVIIHSPYVENTRFAPYDR